jgi:hypothetical protein
VTKTEKFVEKIIIVIESCTTQDQLIGAVRYTALAVHRILQNKGFNQFKHVNTLTSKLDEQHIKLLKENI